MSVTIRLAKVGKRNQPSYKIVVANTRSKRNGAVLDTIGFFNPSEKKVPFSIDKAKLANWQTKGALTTASVQELVAGTYKFVPYISAKKLKAAQKNASTEATEKGE